jgi:hypothetical protein
MARMTVRAKTSRLNRAATPATPVDVSAYGRDLDRWPRSWMGLEKDLLPGERLLALFRPFIEHLAASDLSPKTIRRHIDNLWRLGGELIRHLHYDPLLRKMPVDRLLAEAVYTDGGPLIHNGSEEEQRSFDSTCRKLHRFLTQSQT